MTVAADRTRVVDRVLLRLLALAVLAGLAMGATWSLDRIDVLVDGEVQSVSVFGGTVADALDEAEVVLGEADVVTPVASEPLADGMSIEVRRADRFTVVVDGQSAMVETIADDMDDVLVAAGIGDVRELVVQPDMDAEVVDGMVVRVTTPHRVSVEVDDQRLVAEVLPTTVASVLRQLDVDVDDDDEVEPELSAATTPGQVITVTRRGTTTEEVEVAIEHDTDWVATEELLEGDDEVVTDGVDGVEVQTWELTLVDGEEVDRELVDTRVEQEPVDRVVHVGTREPAPDPEPEPEPEPEPDREDAPTSTSAPTSEPTATASATPTSRPDPEPEPTRSTPDPTPTRTPTPEPEPAPTRTPDPEPTSSVWDRLAACESGGRWDLNVGLYDGGLQFHPDTWRAWKKSSYPDYAWQATRSQQIEAASRLQDALGWGQWPHCSRELGLR